MPKISTQTKISQNAVKLIAFLESMSQIFGTAERKLFSAMVKGESVAAEEKKIQAEYRLSSQDVRNALTKADAVYKAQKELLALRIKQKKDAISGLQKSIKTWEKRLKTAKKKGEPTRKCRFAIHGKKRKLHNLESQLKRLEAAPVSVVFGSKNLFKAQHNLEGNGYASHDDWLKDWQDKRSNHVYYEGSKRFESGNLLCRLNSDGHLKITVPACLQHDFGSHVECDGIQFKYAQGWIDAALQRVKYESTHSKTGKVTARYGSTSPITHEFIRKNGDWYLHTVVDLPEIPYITSKRDGAMGIDLNPTSIDWAVCDNQGNLKDKGTIKINIQDKSSNATKDILSKAVCELVAISEKYNAPIVKEKLDFSKKKASMKEVSPRYARMLSNFAYSKFDELLEAKCYRSAIQLIRVNPAYSSLQGITKFMAMYGLNSGCAAALVIARRVYRFSERLPYALHVTLKKPVDSFKHVWGAWNKVSCVLTVRGRKSRHRFYTSSEKTGKANSLLQVTLSCLKADEQGLPHLQLE